MAITGGNPLDYTAADYDLLGKTGPEAASLLANDLQVAEDNVVAFEAATAEGNEALHGWGTEETAAGATLEVGSGLSCHVLNQGFWLSGRRYLIGETIGYLVAELDANVTRHLYMDAVGAVTRYSAKQSVNPEGTWYLGTATTDASACTAVDDSDADRVVTAAVIAGALGVGPDIEELQDALGDDYFDDATGDPIPAATSVTDRLIALESGGSGGTGGALYWGAMQKAASDPTTVDEAIAAAVGAGGGGGGGGETTVVQVPDAVSVANHERLTLRLMHALPEVEQTQKWAYYFVPGISDDALYDAALTTATVDKVNHTIGA